MLGSIDPNHREVTVVGGGIAGLLIAYALDKKGYEVTLHESSSRLGGLIASTQTKSGLVESAAHSFLASEPVLEICRDLGVELVPLNPDSKARYIYRGGRMRRFPLSVLGALIAFFRAYFIPTGKAQDPATLTLGAWGRRYLGKSALEYLLNPFVRGIYAANPDELLVSAAFPRLLIPRGHSLVSWTMHKLLWSRVPKKPRAKMMAPRLGMGDLVNKLEARLRSRLGSRLCTGSEVTTLPDGQNVVLCTPAPVAAHLLKSEQPELSSALGKIRYSPLVTATVFMPTGNLRSTPRGVGVLVPEKEEQDCLGILFNSSSFPGRSAGHVASFTMMLGGSAQPKMVAKTDFELQTIIKRQISEILKLDTSPLDLRITRWPRAIPVYNADLASAWEVATRTWCSQPGKVLFANYTGQISLRGMMELIEQSSGLVPASVSSP